MELAGSKAPLGLGGKSLPLRKIFNPAVTAQQTHSTLYHHDEPAGRKRAQKTSQVPSKQKEHRLDTPQVTPGRSTPKTTKRKDPTSSAQPNPVKRVRTSQPANKKTKPSGPFGCSKCRYSPIGCGKCREIATNAPSSLPKTVTLPKIDDPRFKITPPANPNDPRCDLLGLLVHVPAKVFKMDIPGYYYNGVVTKLEEKRDDAVEVIFEDDSVKYWFPVKDVRRWIREMVKRGVDPESRMKRSTPPASVEPKADEFAATVLTSLSRSTQQQTTDVSDHDVVSSPPNKGGDVIKKGMNVSDEQAASVLQSIMHNPM
jgi:hypothetical protein